MSEFLTFNVENQLLAISINQVERLLWAVEVTPAPKAPKSFLGILNVQGKIIPVINLRQLLNLPKREMKISDQLLICTIGESTAALWIDGVNGIITCRKDEISPGSSIFPNLSSLDYVIKQNDQLIMVYDWDKLIPIEEMSLAIKDGS